ncbi:MAG: ester cyclase [SAR202 cluster bacterium]|nr:ester cyclase [SAR202 cluster bacterium]
MSKQNKEIVCRFLTELQVNKNLAVIDELVADNFVGRTADIHGPAELKKVVGDNMSAFPGMTITIEDQAAEDDLVFTRYTANGLHEGVYRGVLPTGQPVTYTVVTIHRLANGKIMEGWRVVDRLDIVHQIGAVS